MGINQSIKKRGVMDDWMTDTEHKTQRLIINYQLLTINTLN
jgi:hypothetical protein